MDKLSVLFMKIKRKDQINQNFKYVINVLYTIQYVSMLYCSERWTWNRL